MFVHLVWFIYCGVSGVPPSLDRETATLCFVNVASAHRTPLAWEACGYSNLGATSAVLVIPVPRPQPRPTYCTLLSTPIALQTSCSRVQSQLNPPFSREQDNEKDLNNMTPPPLPAGSGTLSYPAIRLLAFYYCFRFTSVLRRVGLRRVTSTFDQT